ncbi:MAG: type IV secretion system DNA-binding domain-containing protein [Candidatus Bathyarchaeota archaeon]|nr:type IV secretion system DNA-binding domain-containing protein [Candidatus Termiticorpusculum sp.]
MIKSIKECALYKERLDTDRQAILNSCESFLNTLWDGDRIIPYYTDHGLMHSLRVIENIEKMLRLDVNVKSDILSDDEIFLLLLAALLHDIGMQCNLSSHKEVKEKATTMGALFESKFGDKLDDDNKEEIRKYHHIITSAWLLDVSKSPDRVTNVPLRDALRDLKRSLRSDLRIICEYHSKKNIDECDEFSKIDGRIRLRFLATLLRLGDELDISEDRVDIKRVKMFPYPEKNSFYWYLHSQTKVKIINNKISLKLMLSENDVGNYKHEFVKYIKQDFYEKNSGIIELLQGKYSLPIFLDVAENCVVEGDYEDLRDEVISILVDYVNKSMAQEQGVDRQRDVKQISFDYTNSLTMLAEQGDANTQYRLGRCYNGENDEQAICVFKDINGQKVIFDENLLSKHLLFIGGIGTGKTNAIYQVIEQFQANLSENDVMVIFDAKGDYYKEFYRHGLDIVISNDDKSVGIDGKKDYWNIFNEIERDNHMEENIIEVSKTLFNEKRVKSQQPFFSLAAKDLFSAVLFHCCRDKDSERFYNSDLRQFLESANVEIILKMINLHGDLKAMKNYVEDGTSNIALGVLAELQELIREIFVGNFKQKGTLSIRKLVREKKGRIIFIEYDIGTGKTLTPIYSLLFDLAIKEALCRTKNEGNVYFIADEFKLLPHLQHIDNAVNFGRSLGVKFLIGVQNIEQVYEVYSGSKNGSERARNLLSSFSTSICFRVNDKKSREYIQSLHGKNRKLETFMSSIPNRGIEEKIREAYVVEDWDISRLNIGQAIIGLPNNAPFLFTFKEYKSKKQNPLIS